MQERRRHPIRRLAVGLTHKAILTLVWITVTLYEKACALDWTFTKWRRRVRHNYDNGTDGEPNS